MDFDADKARLARIIITPANTDHTSAHPGAFFFRHKINAAMPFIIARKV
jgi:hypothetical protein